MTKVGPTVLVNQRGPHWFRRILAGVTVEEVQRFDAADDTTRTDLGRSARLDGGSNPWDQDLENARRHRDSYKLEAAWTALKSAKRSRIEQLSPDELAAEVQATRREAVSKLDGWRRETVAALLPDGKVESTAAGGRSERSAEPRRDLERDMADRLRLARQMLDDRSDNMHHEFRLLRRAVISTSVVLAAVLLGLIAVVAFDLVPERIASDDSPLGSWQLLLAVMVLGAVGAFLSSATELRHDDGQRRLPDLRVGYTLMGMRPIVGAAGSVAVIVVLQSALGDAVELKPTAVLGVAVAAGFTERLVTRTVTSATSAVGG